MANTILVGAQWGDEGKGKIIDYLTEKVDIVVRSQGGANAGHTVLIGDKQYILHLIPSGILRPGKKCVIGNGVVIDAPQLVGEMDGLEKKGVKLKGRFHISDCAHLVLPYHKELDAVRDKSKGKKAIGTTKRGIGPAYEDKAARTGLRMGDLIKPAVFEAKLKERIKVNNQALKAFGEKPLSFKKVLAEYQKAGRRLAPYVTNTVVMLHKAVQKKSTMLFEGAQGTFLDIDHGTYPFVTSSNSTSGGACTGSGVAPSRIDKVLGVMKAYTTRVGGGPLPSEDDDISDMLHNMGREFGATTARPRRCGWFDAVAVKHAVMVNGIDHMAVTNLDGLDGLAKIKVCVAYKIDGKRTEYVPSDIDSFARCKPVYREFHGWQTPTDQIRNYKDLPLNARKYLKALAAMIETKMSIISVGPARDQTMVA